MSDDTTAVDGANTAAPAETEVAQTEQQETSAAPAEAEQGQEAERDEQGRFKRRDAQERINELTRARRQAERERDAYAQQLAQYANQQQTQQRPAENLPAFEDFNDLNAWGRAVAEKAADQARQAAAMEFATRQQQSTQAQVFSTYEAREREYVSQHPEYRDAYDALQSSVRFDQAVLEVLADSDAGPAIVHYLGEHLDAADRIQRMPPHKAAAEIARIEARVKAPKPKPVSKAPSPVPALGGGSAAQKDPDQMTTDEWVVWRRNQLKAK